MNFFRHSLSFILRQIYRVSIIFPYLGIVYIIQLLINLFSKESKHLEGITFLLTSVIFVKEKELSYHPVRSVYTAEERAYQTLQTIGSIRKKVPSARIILIESGLQENLPLSLAGQVDQYIYVGKNFFVRHACDSKYKSLGEAMMLIVALKKITSKSSLTFKISGRYYLDENFSSELWKTRCFKFFFIREDYISTRLYSFSNRMLLVWKFALIKGLPLLLLGYPIEHILPRFIPKKYISTIDRVGVAGTDGTSGNKIKE